MEYIAYLHKDPKSDFGVSFPDFPGCITAGKTLDGARLMASEALALHVRGSIQRSRPRKCHSVSCEGEYRKNGAR